MHFELYNCIVYSFKTMSNKLIQIFKAIKPYECADDCTMCLILL